jgi:hypothetical protein
MANTERPGRRIWFLLAIVMIMFGIWSFAVAATTADDCGDLDKTWQVFPPEWECHARPGFG